MLHAVQLIEMNSENFVEYIMKSNKVRIAENSIVFYLFLKPPIFR